MNADSKLYYLPAFMRMCIEHYSDGGAVSHAALFQLLIWTEDHIHPNLTMKQRHCLVDFINYVENNHGLDLPKVPFTEMSSWFKEGAKNDA